MPSPWGGFACIRFIPADRSRPAAPDRSCGDRFTGYRPGWYAAPATQKFIHGHLAVGAIDHAAAVAIRLRELLLPEGPGHLLIEQGLIGKLSLRGSRLLLKHLELHLGPH